MGEIEENLGELPKLILGLDKMEDTHRILNSLTRKELINLSLEAQERFGTNDNPLVHAIMNIMEDKEMFNE